MMQQEVDRDLTLLTACQGRHDFLHTDTIPYVLLQQNVILHHECTVIQSHKFRHTHSGFRFKHIHTCGMCILAHREPCSRERSTLAALRLKSLESTRGEHRDGGGEGGRQGWREILLPLISQRREVGQRRRRKRRGQQRGLWGRGVYQRRDSLSNICACVISTLCHTAQCL